MFSIPHLIQSLRRASCRMLFFFILWIIAGPIWSGIPQEPEELFEKELITACLEDDEALVRSLIEEHRLWVKPVVDQLITGYIIQVLEKWTKTYTKSELFELGQLMGFPWAPVQSPMDLTHCPQLKSRDFFAPMDQPETGSGTSSKPNA